VLQIAENRQIARSGIPHCFGYTVNGLVHLPPSKTRLALVGFALSVRFGLSLREAAQLVGVSVSYVGAVSHLASWQRAQLITGTLRLSHVVNGRKRSGCPELKDLLKAATPTERAEAARCVGPRVIWDEMVVPLLDEEPAAVE
jgi:hypothetical protein